MTEESKTQAGVVAQGATDSTADFVRRCKAYLEDAPLDGRHSDAAGSNAYELIEEAIQHLAVDHAEGDTVKTILDGIGEALESRGYAHMTNGRDIGLLLDELEQLRSRSPAVTGSWSNDSEMVALCMDMLGDVPGDTLDQRLERYISEYMAFQLRSQPESNSEPPEGFIEIEAADQIINQLRAQVASMKSALTQFVAVCDTAPPTSLMIELGMACKAAKSALSSTDRPTEAK